MRAKTAKIILLSLVGVFVLLGAYGCSTTPRPTQPPVTNLTPSVEAQVFKLSASNFRSGEDQVLVDVCMNLPDNQDWMLDRPRLQLGGLVMDASGGESLEYQPAGDNGQPGRRCDILVFDVPAEPDLSEAVLTIDSISAPPREGQYCAFLLNTVQPILDQRASGIVLECTEQTGYSDARVISKPDSMSQAEAEQIAFNPAYFRIDGPWQFSSQDIPTATPFPTAALDDPTVDPYTLLRTLNQIADANLVYPGWVYLQEDWQHDIDPPNLASQGGMPLPKQYTRETWLRLDKDRRVIQSVSLVKDHSGKILETTVFKNGVYQGSNATESYLQNPYRFHLNEPFFGNLQANLKNGNGEAVHTTLDGLPVIEFKINENFSVDDPNLYLQPITGDQVSAILDTASGQLKMLKTLVTLRDGSQRTLEMMRLQIQSGIQAPPDVVENLVKTQQP